jgi:hypothetical protein
VDCSEQEARTMLAAFLNISNLLLLFVLRKLGNTLAEIDRAKLSESALLKQVSASGRSWRQQVYFISPA